MTIDEKIKLIAEKHNKVISEFPEIDQINWDIKNIRYAEFDKWRKTWNAEKVKYDRDESSYIDEHEICGSMVIYLHSWMTKLNNCIIRIWSVPVKFKHTYEVLEEGVND